MLTDPDLLLYAAIGATVVAALFFGLWLSSRRPAAAARWLEQQNAALSATNQALQADAARSANWAEELSADMDSLRAAHQAEMAARIQSQSELQTLTIQHEARLEELRGMKTELEHKFSALASGVLKQNSENFLNLVSERFQTHSKTAEEDLTKRQAAIENMVKPLDEKLGHFGERIKEIEAARNEAYGAIKMQVKHLADGQAALGGETRKLVQALRAPKTRGRWGEMQLKQVFEMAGMSEHVDYDLEKSMGTDEGLRRPDAIVRIPGGKSIVVDAKTPLAAYLDALESEVPEEQTAHLARHAQQVRTHVKQLASKSYQSVLGETPDFVVMFIPGETFVSAAAEADPGLIEYAFEHRVLIATPTTLMALVKSIAYGWQQEKMAENAVEVQKTAKELYDRLAVFSKNLAGVGRALSSSVANYNKAVGSLESRVLPSARKFEAMGVVAQSGQLETPALAETEPRQVAALLPED